MGNARPRVRRIRMNAAALKSGGAWLGFSGSWIDDGFYFGDGIGRESALGGMFADELLIGSDIDTVDFVAGDVALNPLNFGTELAQDAAGSLGDGMELLARKVAGTGNFALDDVLGHGTSVEETRTGRDSVRGSAGGMESLGHDISNAVTTRNTRRS
jgi:hypothetical protein